MNPVERFVAYAQAFEEAFANDDWSVVEPHFTEDAIYEILAEPPLGGRHEGRDAVLAFLKLSLDTFDRRFDSRALEVLEGPEQRGDGVWLRWRVTYAIAGAPDLSFGGEETLEFAGDRIARLEDRYAEGAVAPVMQYMGEHGEKLHPVGGAA
jgi:hypothetical protein